MAGEKCPQAIPSQTAHNGNRSAQPTVWPFRSGCCGAAESGGNWMIRGFGTEASVLEIPALDGFGLAGLALLLAGAAIRQSIRRARAGAPEVRR